MKIIATFVALATILLVALSVPGSAVMPDPVSIPTTMVVGPASVIGKNGGKDDAPVVVEEQGSGPPDVSAVQAGNANDDVRQDIGVRNLLHEQDSVRRHCQEMLSLPNPGPPPVGCAA